MVSGAAAIYWNTMPDDTKPTEIKDVRLNSCVKGKFDIASYAPSSFANQTVNCFLYISTPSQKLFCDIMVVNMKKRIADREEPGEDSEF